METDVFEEAAKEISTHLERTGLFESRDTSFSPGQVHILGRVKKEDQKVWVHTVYKGLLYACKKDGTDCFLGNQYMLDDKTGTMLFGWVVSLSGKDPARLVDVVSSALDDLDVGAPEPDVIPVLGGRGRRNVSPVKASRSA